MESRYKLIYADPPWQFNRWNNDSPTRSAERHYNTVSIKDLKLLDIGSVADKDSVLLMWATFPRLNEAIELGESWGFVYKTVAFVWVKTNKVNTSSLFVGCGYYTRANAEVVLLFTKGKGIKRIRKDVRQVVLSPVSKHSQKPDEVRTRIVDLFGDVKRLEMYARSRGGLFSNDEYSGWDVYGDEVDSSIVIKTKEQI